MTVQRSVGQRRSIGAGRILGMIAAMFPILAGLDVMGQGSSGGGPATLAVHMAMAVPLILALAVAWRWQRSAAVVYLTLAVGYALVTFSRGGLVQALLVAGPLVLIAGLFHVGTSPSSTRTT